MTYRAVLRVMVDIVSYLLVRCLVVVCSVEQRFVVSTTHCRRWVRNDLKLFLSVLFLLRGDRSVLQKVSELN
eukprot:5554081-Amphidinium_carterae.1